MRVHTITPITVPLFSRRAFGIIPMRFLVAPSIAVVVGGMMFGLIWGGLLGIVVVIACIPRQGIPLYLWTWAWLVWVVVTRGSQIRPAS